MNPLFITYDLETNSLGIKADIIQISAVSISQPSKYFDKYISTNYISKESQDVTGLSLVNGRLYRNNEQIETVNTKEALGEFLKFIDIERLEHPGCKIILVGHNGNTFDAPRLKYQLIKESLDNHPILTDIGFGCSLSLSKFLNLQKPGIYKHRNGGYGLRNVINQIDTNFKYKEHDSLEDSRAVGLILSYATNKIKIDEIIKGLNIIDYNDIV